MKKFLAVEILVCYLNHTWDTEYVYIPYPEAGEMPQETKDRAIEAWKEMHDKRVIDLDTLTYIGIYSYNMDEPVDENGDMIDE